MIEPKYIHIQNFNNITDVELDLSNSVSLFIGDNGSGKSSVVDAIGLCLFEYKRSDTYGDYIKSGTDYSKIHFECNIGDEPITFDIKVEKSGLEREVDFQGKKYHNSEVSELLERLNLKYFSSIFCSMQGEKDITKLSPTERVTYIQKLLAFSFAPQIKQIDDNIKLLTDNITALSVTNTTVKQTIDNLEKQILPVQEIGKEYNDIESIKAKAEMLKSYIIDKTAALRSNAAVSIIKDKINKEIVLLSSEVSGLNDKVAKASLAKDNIVKINKKIEEVSANRQLKEHELGILEQSLANIVESYNQQNSSIQTVTAEVLGAESLYKQCKANFEKVDHDKCPYCGQPILESDKQFHKNELDNAGQNLERLRQVLKAEQEKLPEITKAKSEMETQKSVIIGQISSYKYQVDTLNNELKASQLELEQLEPVTQKVNELNNQIAEKQNMLKLEDSKLLEVDNDEWNKNQQELDNCNKIIESYNKLVEANDHIKATNEVLQKSIEQQRKTLDENITKYTALSDDLAVYKEGKQIFEKKLPQFIIIKTCKKIEEKLNTLIQTIFSNLYVKLFYSKKGIEFFYSTSGIADLEKEAMLPIKQASGFEKAILSICFKSVLCEAYDIPFVILDEIDSAATEDNSRRLFDIIINGGLFKQSIIISHKLDVQNTIKGMSDSISSYYVMKGNFEVA